MIKLTNILNELNINRPITLSQLERWQNEIEASNDPTTKLRLALKCAESVLFIFEREYPGDPRPRNAINALRTYLNNPSEKNKTKCLEAANNAAMATIDDDAAYAAAYVAYAAACANENSIYHAANRAIAAFKKYNKLNELNELRVNNPNVTVEKAYIYWEDNICYNNIEFDVSSNGWKEYKDICKYYNEKYNISGEDYIFSSLTSFKKLSKSDLNKIYSEMRVLVRKHVGKEIL